MSNSTTVYHLNQDPALILSKLSTKAILKKLFDLKSPDACISIQQRDTDSIIGTIDVFSCLLFFKIDVTSSNNPKYKTLLEITTSGEPSTFTLKYEKQLQKQTKNNYKISTIAAVAFVVLLIPSGIAINDHIQGYNTTISDTEKLLYLSQQSNNNDNPKDSIYYADKLLAKQSNIDVAIQVREAYSNLEKYDVLLPQKTSLITIESPDMVMFYPDKDKAGFAIPKENNDSFKLDNSGDIPIVYPVNGKYPLVLFNEDDQYPPTIISPNSPNYSKILSQSSQDESIVQPILRVDVEDNVAYAESPVGGTNDPIVVYPYGFGEDVPVIVFPDQEHAVTTLINNYAPRQNHLVYGTQTTVTSEDLVPIEYVEINLNEMENIQNNNGPVRIFPQGPNSLSVEFPFGVDSRPLFNYVPSIVDTVTSSPNTAGTIAASSPNTAGTITSNPTLVVTIRDSTYDDSNVNYNSITANSYSSSGIHVSSSGLGINTGGNGSPGGFGGYGGSGNNDGSPPQDNDDGSDISDEQLLAWSKEYYKELDLQIAQGDPNIFTIDNTIEPCTIKMYPDQAESLHWKFDLFVTNIPLKMDRTLCDGTYMMFVDFNHNGILDDGYEALWHPDYTTYDIMSRIDYDKGIQDGKIDINDDKIWKDVMIMDSNYKTYKPSEFGITGFGYADEVNLGDDRYGPGVYSDCLYEGNNLYPNCKPVSNTHFRVISWNPQGLIFVDGTTKPTYGALQGPLLDCSIYDARYMIAEKQLSEWNLDEAMRLYEEGLAYCNSMEFTSEDPDKLLSHWVAGKASYYHRDGQLEEAKPLYEEALKMSPDRHFYLTDYALLLDQLGFDADVTLPIVERALEIDPDHGYAHTVKDRILS